MDRTLLNLSWARFRTNPKLRFLIEHLPRIQNSVRVQRAAQFAHHLHLCIAGKLWQKTFLRQADPVFAGDRAAEPDGFIKDFLKGLFHAVYLILVALVREEGRMQIAVAYVAERADAELVFP